MKAIPALLAMVTAALASPGDPGQTAIQFLEKVRTQTLNLEPDTDTALSPQTSSHKRQEIARRLQRVARDLGNDPLELGAMKLDDGLAAVLVRKLSDFDPSRLQVFPVALVKRGVAWIAAPVPASFENAGIGYAGNLRQRLALLEDWMLRQQVIELEHLHEQSADRMRRKINQSLPAATLRTFSSRQTADRFLAACEQHNLPEMFGLLGGLSANLLDDWPLRLTAADTAVAAAAEVKHPWRLLIAPEVLRALVHHEEDHDTAMVSIACLDPAGSPARSSRPRVELVHLELSKSSDGLWRIDPPANFLEDHPPPDTAADDDLDADLLNAFPAKLTALYPPSPQPAAEQTRRMLLDSLRTGGPASLLRYIALEGEPKAALKACARAAQLWWSLRDPSAVRGAMPLAFQQTDELAAAACQFFSARNPDRLDLKILYFAKSTAGWHWTPEPRSETETAFREWSDQQSKGWQNDWQRTVLSDCPCLAQIPVADAPAEEACRRLIGAWLEATRAGDVAAALRLTARLNMADSEATLLRNLGYELTGARRNQRVPTISGVYRGKICTAVGTQAAANDPPACPLYPIIATPAGPRILLEIDLLASSQRSRGFLNKTAFDRLRKANASAADELAGLFAQHQAQAVPAATP